MIALENKESDVGEGRYISPFIRQKGQEEMKVETTDDLCCRQMNGSNTDYKTAETIHR